MIAALLPFLPTILVSVIGAVSEKHKAAADQIIADRNARRDERVQESKERAAIITAEQGWWFSALPRPVIALTFAFYLFWVVIIDKIVCKWVWGVACATDPLSPELAGIMQVIIAAYFGGRTIEKTARIVTGAIARRK